MTFIQLRSIPRFAVPTEIPTPSSDQQCQGGPGCRVSSSSFFFPFQQTKKKQWMMKRAAKQRPRLWAKAPSPGESVAQSFQALQCCLRPSGEDAEELLASRISTASSWFPIDRVPISLSSYEGANCAITYLYSTVIDIDCLLRHLSKTSRRLSSPDAISSLNPLRHHRRLWNWRAAVKWWVC